MERHKIMVTVKETRAQEGYGKCKLYKPGDQFLLEDYQKINLCRWAYNSMMPFLTVIEFGGKLPWEEEGKALVSCPDPRSVVVFELERVTNDR